MLRSSKTLPLLIALGFPSLAWAEGTLVLPPLIPKGVEQKVSTNVTSLLSTELDFSGNFETIKELPTAPVTLKETCLTQTTCLQGIAKTNGGTAVVAGTIGPGPEGVQIFLVYYDAQKNTIVRKKTYNVGKEPSAIADRATSMVKELLSGESTAAAKADAAPMSITAPAEDDDFAFEEPVKPTISKTTTATTSGKTRPTVTAAPKSLEDEGEDDGGSVSVARSDSRDEPEYEEPEEAEKAAAAQRAAVAAAKAEAEARAAAKARADAEIRARNEAAAKARADAAAKAQADAEARARADAEAKARAEAEARAVAEAEARAEAEAAAQAKAEAAAQAKADADERARAAAQAKADAAAQARADAAAAAAAKAAASRTTAPAKTADDDIFSFGSGSGAIEIETDASAEVEEEAPAPPRKSYYDRDDTTSTKSTASSRYTDLDTPAPRASSATTKTRPTEPLEEDEPVRSTSSSRSSTARTVDPDESLDEDPVEDPSDYTDLDEEPPSRSSSSSRSAVADEERSSSSRDSARSSSAAASEARTTRSSDDEKPRVTITGRGGYARFYDFNFVTYGGEAGIPMGRSAALLVGIEGFSTQRHFSEADIATIAAETGQDPSTIPTDPWNTILPFNFGVVYKSSTHAVRPYAGVDIILAPYTETFDLAVGARVRAGADFMVAETFGLNLNLSGGILSGKEFEKIDPQVKNTGLLPQLSAGTVFSF